MQTNKFEFIADKIRDEGMRYEEAQMLYHLKIGLDAIDRERARKAEQLKQQIEAGTYPVTGAQVAGRMLCAEHGTPVSDAGCTFCRVQKENDAARQTEEEAARWRQASRHWQGEDFRQEPGMAHIFDPPPTPAQNRARNLHTLKVALLYLLLVGMVFGVFAAQEQYKGMKHEQEIREGRR